MAMLNTILVDVFYTNSYHQNNELIEYDFKQRQISSLIDDNLIIIMEFEDVFESMCKSCEKQQQHMSSKFRKDYESFLNKYKKLLAKNENDLTKLIRTDQKNLIKHQKPSLINCIGCRTSLEKFYKQLQKNLSNNKSISNGNLKYSYAIDPFLIDSSGQMTLKEQILNNSENPFILYSFFYLNSSKLEDFIDQIVKFKKTNKRCNLHSLDYITNQKSTTASSLAMAAAAAAAAASAFQFSSSSTSSSRRSVSPIPFSSSASISSSSTSSIDQIAINSNNSFSAGSTSLIKSDWLVVWNSFLSDDLRLKCLVIDTSKFMLTLDTYLRKHKFCNDCKLKVIKAYNLLIGESDPSKEKGYCADLYEGVRCCSNNNQQNNCFYHVVSVEKNKDNKVNNFQLKNNKNSPSIKTSSLLTNNVKNYKNKHLHVKNDKKFVSFLISKAEPDLLGSRRERHAKTIDIAQEEVLTCIGIYLYERFHLIYQTIKSEEQTWILLYYSSLFTLKKCLELEFEKMQGVSNLELICAELEAMEELQEERKRIKKERKKQRKLNKQAEIKMTNSDKSEDNQNLNSKNEIRNSMIEENEELKENVVEIHRDENNNQNHIEEKHNSQDEKTEPEDENTTESEKNKCRCNNNSDTDNTFLYIPSFQLMKDIINNQENYLIQEIDDEKLIMITDEEKNEYYANKTMYLIERKKRRELLKQKFQSLKMNANLKIRPRNFNLN